MEESEKPTAIRVAAGEGFGTSEMYGGFRSIVASVEERAEPTHSSPMTRLIHTYQTYQP